MGAPKQPKLVRPWKVRPIHPPEAIIPGCTGYKDCMCNVFLDEDARKREIKRSKKHHEELGTSRGAAKRFTVIVDLEESGSELEKAYAALAVIEAQGKPTIVSRMPNTVKQKDVKKPRVRHPYERSKPTVNLAAACVCDFGDSDCNSSEGGREVCSAHDLLQRLLCNSLRRVRSKPAAPPRVFVKSQESDTESSENKAVIKKKPSLSAPVRAKESNEVQGKKRKLEGPTIEPAF
ncbi:hypothetical protein MMC34_002142 [Xylographa carneopallida]|nr:hypothetical protein [Xylographa carneopallida]